MNEYNVCLKNCKEEMETVWADSPQEAAEKFCGSFYLGDGSKRVMVFEINKDKPLRYIVRSRPRASLVHKDNEEWK
jgi:hypothetical protein